MCGSVSMLGEQKVPCACEADVYGALTQLVLQEVADAPVFLTDLVDIDTGTSGVVRFEQDASIVMDAVMNSGLEHHMALAYGDHRTALRGAAGAMGLPLLEI